MNNYIPPLQTQIVESLFIKRVAVILMRSDITGAEKLHQIEKEYKYMAGYLGEEND